MTDNDIIMGLECCSKSCSENFICCACPYAKLPVKNYCGAELSKDSLDLINRQKAEIEKLKNTDFQVEVSSRLEKEIRAEAIKEFAENLKQQAFSCDVSFGFGKEHYTKAVAVIEIDKIVEEMTEVKNNA